MYWSILYIRNVAEPDLASGFKYSVPIMVWGMERGVITGASLKKYISVSGVDYVGARKVINGQDRADLVAAYAIKFGSILERSSKLSKGC